VFAELRRGPRSLVADRSPRSWLIAMTVTGFAGCALAAYWATEPILGLPSVSRLGIDARASGILNATLLALGATLFALGLSFKRAFAKLRHAGRLSRQAEAWLVAGFILAGSAVTVTGLFPVDAPPSTVVHNLAGFAAPIVLMLTVLGARLALGDLGFRFDAISAAIMASIVGAFAATSSGHLVPYAAMELICFGMIGAWLWLFEARLRRLINSL
jgi:hypothetical protein